MHSVFNFCATLPVWTAVDTFSSEHLQCVSSGFVLSSNLCCQKVLYIFICIYVPVSLSILAAALTVQHPAVITTSKLLCCSTFWGLAAQGSGALTTKKNLPKIAVAVCKFVCAHSTDFYLNPSMKTAAKLNFQSGSNTGPGPADWTFKFLSYCAKMIRFTSSFRS